jgi:hypothetical protein
MSKRVAVAPTSTPSTRIPSDLIAFNKEPTDVYDDFTVLLPSQLSTITVTTGNDKIKLELPNLKSLRLNQIMVECTVTPGFSSTSGSDTYASIVRAANSIHYQPLHSFCWE